MLRAIEVGDIGYLDDSGEFHAILNIFFPFQSSTGHRFQPVHIKSHSQESMIKRLGIQKRFFFTSDNIIRMEYQRNEWVDFSFFV